MPIPTKDCQCEDFPCCEHADNFPVDDNPAMYYCDMCGFSHVGDCPDDFEDEVSRDFSDDDEFFSGGREEPHADLLLRD